MGKRIKISKWENIKQVMPKKAKLFSWLIVLFLVGIIFNIYMLCSPVLKNIGYTYSSDEGSVTYVFSDNTYKKTSKHNGHESITVGFYYVAGKKIVIDNIEFQRNSVFSIEQAKVSTIGDRSYELSGTFAIILQAILFPSLLALLYKIIRVWIDFDDRIKIREKESE